MSICLHPYRRIYRGYKLPQSQIQRNGSTSSPKVFRFLSRNPGSHQEDPSRSRHVYQSTPPSFPVPRSAQKDPSGWVPYLTRYVPNHIRGKPGDTVKAKEIPEARQCQEILDLLFQARSQSGFDLLTYLGFTLGRWQDFHAIVDKLLDNADNLRPSLTRGFLPSNIDWGRLGSFDEITDHDMDSISSVQYSKSDISFSSFDTYSEEPIMVNRMGENATRIGTMEEVWQSLGLFVIKAADLPLDEASSTMSHFYRIVARLHHLDMVPHDVYKHTPNIDPARPNRPPGMHLLSRPIMNVLSETAWESNLMNTALDSVDQHEQPQPSKLMYKSRELGFGIWFEFILWCCVEGGFAKEACWILQKTNKSNKEWKVKSWNKVVETSGQVDLSKMGHYDTWERCGEKSNVPRVDQSGRPFLGMGARTITQEVVVATMDGLADSLRVGVGTRGDSPIYAWDCVAILRSILRKNKLYVNSRYINYLIVRILEAGSVVPEVMPRTLELLLNLAPYIPTETDLKDPGKATRQKHAPDYSKLVLGLYQYTLNLYAASGNISGTIDVFERLLGAVDSSKVHDIRKSILEPKYLISARTVRDTESVIPKDSNPPKSPTLPISPLTWSLLLDVLTSSGVHQLTTWLLKPGPDGTSTLPTHLYGDRLVAASLIRFAAMTKNRDLFFIIASNVSFPLQNTVLYSLLDYHIRDFDWKRSTRLLSYLRDTKDKQWDAATVARVAASIVRLDHQINTQTETSSDSTKNLTESLQLAKQVLVDIFSRKFDKYNVNERDRTNDGISYHLRRLFKNIPGTLSEMLPPLDVNWDDGYTPGSLIPADAFNQILASVVDTQGILVGKRLWDRFCLKPQPPHEQRIQKGGNALLLTSKELNSLIGGIEPSYSLGPGNRNKNKIAVPDLTTVRIIAQAALKERELIRPSNSQSTSLAPHSRDNITLEEVHQILDWSSNMFGRLHLGKREIARELDAHVTRISAERHPSLTRHRHL